jgi:5'-nucleotidase (lipoprotein e(P4) family)
MNRIELSKNKTWIFGFLCGIGCSCVMLSGLRVMQTNAIAQEAKKSVAGAPIAKESPPYRGLDANLYMQTSAEYRACCLQAYAWAERLIAERLELGNLKKQPEKRPRAVVFDLDETVLDNGRFQTKQIRSGNAFDSGLWTQWEQTGGDELDTIPGAVPFIRKLESLGIQRFYITNRNESCHAQTLAALERLGIPVPPDQLLCANETTGTNKTTRRATAEARFEVMLYLGDNLRDFDEAFRFSEDAGIENRKRLVDTLGGKLGREWIILPNPAYGEWLKPLGRGEADANQLLPKL